MGRGRRGRLAVAAILLLFLASALFFPDVIYPGWRPAFGQF